MAHVYRWKTTAVLMLDLYNRIIIVLILAKLHQMLCCECASHIMLLSSYIKAAKVWIKVLQFILSMVVYNSEDQKRLCGTVCGFAC